MKQTWLAVITKFARKFHDNTRLLNHRICRILNGRHLFFTRLNSDKELCNKIAWSSLPPSHEYLVTHRPQLIGSLPIWHEYFMAGITRSSSEHGICATGLIGHHYRISKNTHGNKTAYNFTATLTWLSSAQSPNEHVLQICAGTNTGIARTQHVKEGIRTRSHFSTCRTDLSHS